MMDVSVFVFASFEGLCEWLHAYERKRKKEGGGGRNELERLISAGETQ